jgi:hypothetical protein
VSSFPSPNHWFFQFTPESLHRSLYRDLSLNPAPSRLEPELRTLEPVLGWRVWWLKGERLKSWAMDYVWERGSNHASCMKAPDLRCSHPPGYACACGFWGLWGPTACAQRARSDPARGSAVLGLVSGWGTVALHGSEGFRAESASIVCVFVDELERRRPWKPMAGLLAGLRARHDSEPARGDVEAETGRRSATVRRAAQWYGVPAMSMSVALRFGLLTEMGVTPQAIQETKSLVSRQAS